MNLRPRAGVSGASRTSRTLPAHRTPPAGRALAGLAAAVLALASAACSTGDAAPEDAPADRPLVIGAIPDQDTDRLQEIYGATASYLSEELGLEVEYRPVTDYAAAVNQFRTGDLDLVWFGGLTGVQARLQTPGAAPLVQRDIDDEFHSVFIAGTGSGLAPVQDAAGLAELAGQTFTFGSESSTSGYLMPASFLLEAGVDPEEDLDGLPGFSGSHDKTIDLVESGSYAAGALNEQVWESRLAAGDVDTATVQVLWRSPAFADYHWLLGPSAVEDLGDDLPERVTAAFTGLSADDPEQAALLELFGAGSFEPTTAAAYDDIEETGRRLGLVSGG